MAQYVLYHADCYDGFGAAWVAHQHFGAQAAYLPVAHGNPPPAIPDQSDILIVDFAYPRPVLEELATRTHLTVLDHHKTAEADLAGLPYCTFDMHRSGAMLAWDYLFPQQAAPSLIQYVQDRDLWRFALPGSREVSAWLASYPLDFTTWSELVGRLEQDAPAVIQEGAALLRLKQQYVEEMGRTPSMVTIAGYRVPAVNATVCVSEVGEYLCARYPEAPFAAIWRDRADGKRQWSLRSEHGFDVSAVAKRFGGGGHAAAAGFVQELDLPIRVE